MDKKELVIKCPYCGAEYLLCEIFYPDDLLGDASNIIKDDNGKIIFYDGEDTNIEETYVCDWCDKEFKATLKLDIETSKPDVDFDDDFASDIE